MGKIELLDGFVSLDDLYDVLTRLNQLGKALKLDLTKSNNTISALNILRLTEVYDGIVLSRAGKASDLYLIKKDADGNWTTRNGKKLVGEKEKKAALELAVKDAKEGTWHEDAVDGAVICELKSLTRKFDTILDFFNGKLEFAVDGGGYFFTVKRGDKEVRVFVFAFNNQFDSLKSMMFITTENGTIDRLIALLQKAQELHDYVRWFYGECQLRKVGRAYNRSSLIFKIAMLSFENSFWHVRDEFGRWDFNREFDESRWSKFQKSLEKMFNIDDKTYNQLFVDSMIGVSREYNKMLSDLTALLQDKTRWLVEREHLSFDPLVFLYKTKDGTLKKLYRDTLENTFWAKLRDLFELVDPDLVNTIDTGVVRYPQSIDTSDEALEKIGETAGGRVIKSVTAIAFDLARKDIEALGDPALLRQYLADPLSVLDDDTIKQYIEKAKAQETKRRETGKKKTVL